MTRKSPDELKEMLRDFRRDQIVDTARRIFEERGTTDVSMDEIAAQSGVARSTVYVYFANRDEILRACLKRMHALLLDAIVGAWEDEDDPAARLRSLARAMLERIDENPAFFRLALAAQGTGSQASSPLGMELAAVGLDVARLIRDLVGEGITLGRFRPLDPDRMTALIGQQLYGAMSVRADDPAPLDLDAATDELCDFVLRGVTA